MAAFIVVMFMSGAHCLYAGLGMMRGHRLRQMDNPIVDLSRIQDTAAYSAWLSRHYFIVGGAAILCGAAFTAQKLFGLQKYGFAGICGLVCFVVAVAVVILQAVNTRRFYS